MIIDSHCHLDLLEEKGFNIDEIVAQAQKNGVGILQTICTSMSSFNSIIKIINSHQSVYGSVGVHPCNVKEDEIVTVDELVKICKNESKIIGIGETGLDYHYSLETKKIQKESFLNHIEASRITQKPLIIHSRDCDDDMIEILQRQQKIGKFPALLHCFSSSRELALKALEIGVYISLSGILTFKNAKDLQEIAREIPLEMILVETDSPYLAPMPHRGKVNQPAYTKHVVEFLAQLKELTADEVAKQTSNNFIDLFKIKI
jgi:TatD DNase family protein